MKKIIMFSVTVFSCFMYSYSQQSDTFTDSRDNQTYKWVKIGSQVWMAENLNVGTRINSGLWEQVQTNNGTIEKYCYDNTESNCDIYGGLYEWNEMIQYASFDDETIGTIQGICPDG